jgi:hypothetical protein
MRCFNIKSAYPLSLAVLTFAILLRPADAQAQLSSGVKVSGFVRDFAGKPLQGDVTVIQGTTKRVVRNFQTNTVGYYDATLSFPGPAILVAKASGFSSQTYSVAQNQNGQVNFSLRKPIRVTGRVTGRGGTPVANAHVRVRYRDSAELFQFAQEVGDVSTDVDGMFSLEFVKPFSRFVLEVDAPGFQRKHSTDFLSHEAPVTAHLQLESGSTVRGRVIDESGFPVGNAFVTLRPALGYTGSAEPFVTPNTTSSTSGEFTFLGIGKGAYAIIVRKEGFKAHQRRIDVVSENDDRSYSVTLTH